MKIKSKKFVNPFDKLTTQFLQTVIDKVDELDDGTDTSFDDVRAALGMQDNDPKTPATYLPDGWIEKIATDNGYDIETF